MPVLNHMAKEGKYWGVEYALSWGGVHRMWILLPHWRMSSPDSGQPRFVQCITYSNVYSNFAHDHQLTGSKNLPTWALPIFMVKSQILMVKSQNPEYHVSGQISTWKRNTMHVWDKNSFQDYTRWQSKWSDIWSFPFLWNSEHKKSVKYQSHIYAQV